MDKRLIYISGKSSFTNDQTGEVVSGGRIAICDLEPSYTESGSGCYTDIKWIPVDLLEKLRKDPRSNDLPHKVKVILENRGLNSKPKIQDIEFVD